jgi:hypothetical protein
VVTGTGAIDVVFVHGYVGNLEAAWKQPLRVAFFERLGSFARVIEFDNIGARVAARAQPEEILVSSTVKDLVAGSGIGFEDRGTAELKGVPGTWQLFAVQ